MKWRIHTGPCSVNEVGAAVAHVPGTTGVIIGTEHVLFHFLGSPREFLDIAAEHDRTKSCWAFVKGMKPL